MRQVQNPIDLLPQVLSIARKADEAIMAVYTATASTPASFKTDGSPLTQADLAAHRHIARGLAALTPDIPVVSEEDDASQAHRQPRGRFWLVDPLDGTKEFLARNEEFTVNIALVQDGVAVLGVVTAPALGLAYWGSAGRGAFRSIDGRTEAIHVARRPPAASYPWRVVASKSHMNEETRAWLQQLGAHELVQAGSSLKFCRIAEGNADIYPRLGPTCEWDTAAAQAVLEAAGGCVLQLDGMPLRYGKGDVLNPQFVAAATLPAAVARVSITGRLS